jgi:hypothetical protein
VTSYHASLYEPFLSVVINAFSVPKMLPDWREDAGLVLAVAEDGHLAVLAEQPPREGCRDRAGQTRH